MYKSIFNDVIGPVMRGPSSSHCAAALRIGRLARDLMGGDLCEVRVEYDRHGSLATTHASQGSDMGLFGGLLGWDATDARLPRWRQAIREAGISVRIEIADRHDEHPNTYRLILANSAEEHTVVATSVGGGMIKVIEIDGVSLSIGGDYRETLVWIPGDAEYDTESLRRVFGADRVVLRNAGDVRLLQVETRHPLDDEELAGYLGKILSIRRLDPVLPVLSRRDMTLPFTGFSEMLEYDADRNFPLWKLAVQYESARGGGAEEDVVNRMRDIVLTARRSVESGISGTVYEDRILGCQSRGFATVLGGGDLLEAGMLNRVILYISALMEVKSSMGIIVAAPTAGACGALPGACIGGGDFLESGEDEAVRAMLAGGLIGLFIAFESTFAAEVCGCQAECGAASGMAAAAFCTLGGGTARQGLAAASMALQNSLGMVCDPVANRVEVPCLGKNVMAAANALSCANMALAGFDPVIPLDEVIETMDRVGRSLPRELRCTALGGLSITPAAKEIEKRLT